MSPILQRLEWLVDELTYYIQCNKWLWCYLFLSGFFIFQAFNKFNEGRVAELVDPLMEEVVSAEILTKMFDLAFRCAAPVRADRPDMQSVGQQLWVIRADSINSRKG